MMLEGAGFDVLDLGVDVEEDAFVRAAQENNADFVGVSAPIDNHSAGNEVYRYRP